MTAAIAAQLVLRLVEELLRLLPPSSRPGFLERVEETTRARRESLDRAQARLDARKVPRP